MQMHVAHSATFKGAAIYAGGVFHCAGTGGVGQALNDCGGNGQYVSTLAASESYLDQQSSAGTIDPKSNLSGQKVYLWSGTADSVVKQAEMNDLQSEYQHYGASVTYDNAFAAEHGWESPDGELTCGTKASPYMINCSGYDSEKTWLTSFFGTLNARNNGTLGGSLVNFDQTEFGASASIDMDTNGYVFVPTNCAKGQSCGLVVAYHGCKQTQSDIGTKFIGEAGLNKWADTNNIVVLYPYAVKSADLTNPNGCWDWWGYDDANYSLKSGTQIAITYKMVQRLMAGSSTPTPSPAPTGPTPAPTATPVATATPAVTPTPAITPTPFCTTAANYYHVQAGRAHDSGGYALANGSNQNMGLDNVFYTTTLKQTGPNYYVIGC